MRTMAIAAAAVAVLLAAPPAEAAFSINLCRNLNQQGTYRLTRNIVNPSYRQACLKVTADDVTIDLGGFTITGAAGVGIISDRRGTSVRNGIIAGPLGPTGFGTCIQLGDEATVEDVRVWCENSGIVVGFGSIVRSNRAAGDPLGAIIAGDRSIIIGNIAAAFSNAAIQAGAGSIIVGNVADGDEGVFAGADSTVSSNVIIASDEGANVGPGSNVTGNTFAGGGDRVPLTVECPSSVVGNAGAGSLNLLGIDCAVAGNLLLPLLGAAVASQQ